MAIPNHTGQRGLLIKETREQAGVSQRKLTIAWCDQFAIDWTHRQITRLSDIERGRRYVSPERTADYLTLIAKVAAETPHEAPSRARQGGAA